MISKHRFSVCPLALLGAMAVTVGCGRDAGKQRPSETRPSPRAEPMAGMDRPRPAEPDGLESSEAWNKAVLALGTCGLGEVGIARKCAAYVAIQKRWKRVTQAPKGQRERVHKLLWAIAQERLGSPKPAIRVWAAVQLRPAVHREAKVLSRIFERAKIEKEPAVLQALFYAIRTNWKRGPEYKAFVFEMAGHPAAVVRREAVYGLGYMKGDKSALDKLIHFIKGDPDPRVRAAACKYSGEHGAERLVPVMRKLLADPTKHPRLFAACLYGLFELWNPYYGRQQLSQRAFALTLRVLGRGPYSHTHPPWALIGKLGRVPKLRVERRKTLTPRWYRKSAVVKLLTSLALAAKVHRFGRVGALKALAQLQAARALEKALAKLGKGTDADSRYLAGMARKQLAKLKR